MNLRISIITILARVVAVVVPILLGIQVPAIVVTISGARAVSVVVVISCGQQRVVVVAVPIARALTVIVHVGGRVGWVAVVTISCAPRIAVAVLVLGRGIGIKVIAVALTRSETIPVHIQLIGGKCTVAVVVDTVTQLDGPGMRVGIGVVTVVTTIAVAIIVGARAIEVCTVHVAIAVVVHAVITLFGQIRARARIIGQAIAGVPRVVCVGVDLIESNRPRHIEAAEARAPRTTMLGLAHIAHTAIAAAVVIQTERLSAGSSIDDRPHPRDVVSLTALRKPQRVLTVSYPRRQIGRTRGERLGLQRLPGEAGAIVVVRGALAQQIVIQIEIVARDIRTAGAASR